MLYTKVTYELWWLLKVNEWNIDKIHMHSLVMINTHATDIMGIMKQITIMLVKGSKHG